MNLIEIITRIEDELQHEPEAERWKSRLRSTVKSCYDDLLLNHAWSFLETVHLLQTAPDLRLGAARVDYVDTSSFAVLNAAMVEWIAYGFHLYEEALTGSMWTSTYAGSDGNSAPSPGPGPFICERVGFGADGVVITLDPRYGYDTEKGGYAYGWECSILRWRVPADCAAIHSVVPIVDGKPGRPLESWDEQRNRSIVTLDPKEKGTPTRWSIDTASSNARSRYSIFGTRAESAARPWTGGSGGPPRAPRKAPVVTFQVGSGLELDVEYEWAYTWSYGGEESGLSPSVRATPTDGTKLAAQLTGLETLEPSTLGRDRNVYRRRASGGEWVLVTTVELVDDDVAIDSGIDLSQHYPVEHEVFYYGWNPTWLRLWPRPQEFQAYEVTYLRKPRPLQRDEDVPDFPEQYHEYLVWAAVEKLLGSFGDNKGVPLATRNKNDKLAVMQKHCLRGANERLFAAASPRQGGRHGPLVRNMTISPFNYDSGE